jgi:hypothetical protein
MAMVAKPVGAQFRTTDMTVNGVLKHLFFFLLDAHRLDETKFLFDVLLFCL